MDVFLVFIVNNLYYFAAIVQAAIVNTLSKSNVEGYAVSNFVSYTLTAPPPAPRQSHLFCQENYSKFKNSRIVAMAMGPFNVATNKYAFNFNWFGPPRGFLLVQSQELKTSLDDSGMLGLSKSPSQLHFLSIYEDICT